MTITVSSSRRFIYRKKMLNRIEVRFDDDPHQDRLSSKIFLPVVSRRKLEELIGGRSYTEYVGLKHEPEVVIKSSSWSLIVDSNKESN